MAKSGVYEIVNTVNGKRYIGSSVEIYRRFRYHKNLLRNGLHTNIHLQRAWNLDGESAFAFNLLLLCDKNMTLFYEQICIDGLRCEYNISKSTTATMLGISPSEATRQKLRMVHLGKPKSEEARRKMSEAGKNRSEEHRRKLSEWQKGRTLSEERRRVLSEAHKGIPSPKKGKPSAKKGQPRPPFSEEWKQHISESKKGSSPWNKGKKGSQIPWNKGKKKGA